MPFIGTQPEVGGYSVLDALTASATASYTLQLNSANFSPPSANQLLVSLNGVIQKPGSSFTVSGSTLTFSSALTSNDSIDFILAMGEPLLVGTPSDGTINANKLATNAVTNAKIASGVSASKLTTGTLPHLQLPTGSILQAVNAEKLDSASTNSAMGSWVDTGLTCTITPKASNSKILIHADYAGGVTVAAFNYFRVVRNVGGGSYSMISEAATPGNRNAIHGMVYDADNEGQVNLQTFNHLDSPSTTSAVNYKIQFATGGGGYVYIGQSNRDTNTAAADPRASSRIVLMEIAG